ncbi:MAG: EF-P beta-lysylation protein EpmB [Arenimonas sp.]|uniref:EF-P beta-lysylation protein EpmB n=1 Tax=Arenimonas sp. TaxID=1872635 RepID=UPI0025BE9B12|nr:EF-P beta-lysylation protein EpmB [Arenimonas sp.]MBW8368321.1 EF-P beta-lysylation protein EpmB [Arenimonas sp.]
MITAQPPSSQQEPRHAPVRWQQLWRDAIREPAELLDLLGLPQLASRVSATASIQFAMRVPRGFAARMRHGDPDDPLLRQVLPLDEEDRVVPGFDLDAVGDLDASGGAGILHKYEGRALLVATGSCAIHCRYCFRRHFPYGEQTAAAGQWRESLDYLAADPSISEVLLSGGDPLSLSTPKLAEFTDALARLPHVRRLRLHTRLPVVLPERVDAELLAWLSALPQRVVVVIHANHANEIDESVARAVARLRDAGATVLNQAVLLRGVNDSVPALADLSDRLFDAGVLPYYLHLLDRVAGSAHFEVPVDEAKQLHEMLSARLPGYLVPRLVREVAGAPAKLPA